MPKFVTVGGVPLVDLIPNESFADDGQMIVLSDVKQHFEHHKGKLYFVKEYHNKIIKKLVEDFDHTGEGAGTYHLDGHEPISLPSTASVYKTNHGHHIVQVSAEHQAYLFKKDGAISKASPYSINQAKSGQGHFNKVKPTTLKAPEPESHKTETGPAGMHIKGPNNEDIHVKPGETAYKNPTHGFVHVYHPDTHSYTVHDTHSKPYKMQSGSPDEAAWKNAYKTQGWKDVTPKNEPEGTIKTSLGPVQVPPGGLAVQSYTTKNVRVFDFVHGTTWLYLPGLHTESKHTEPIKIPETLDTAEKIKSSTAYGTWELLAENGKAVPDEPLADWEKELLAGDDEPEPAKEPEKPKTDSVTSAWGKEIPIPKGGIAVDGGDVANHAIRVFDPDTGKSTLYQKYGDPSEGTAKWTGLAQFYDIYVKKAGWTVVGGTVPKEPKVEAPKPDNALPNTAEVPGHGTVTLKKGQTLYGPTGHGNHVVVDTATGKHSLLKKNGAVTKANVPAVQQAESGDLKKIAVGAEDAPTALSLPKPPATSTAKPNESKPEKVSKPKGPKSTVLPDVTPLKTIDEAQTAIEDAFQALVHGLMPEGKGAGYHYKAKPGGGYEYAYKYQGGVENYDDLTKMQQANLLGSDDIYDALKKAVAQLKPVAKWTHADKAEKTKIGKDRSRLELLLRMSQFVRDTNAGNLTPAQIDEESSYFSPKFNKPGTTFGKQFPLDVYNLKNSIIFVGKQAKFALMTKDSGLGNIDDAHTEDLVTYAKSQDFLHAAALNDEDLKTWTKLHIGDPSISSYNAKEWEGQLKDKASQSIVKGQILAKAASKLAEMKQAEVDKPAPSNIEPNITADAKHKSQLVSEYTTDNGLTVKHDPFGSGADAEYAWTMYDWNGDDVANWNDEYVAEKVASGEWTAKPGASHVYGPKAYPKTAEDFASALNKLETTVAPLDQWIHSQYNEYMVARGASYIKGMDANDKQSWIMADLAGDELAKYALENKSAKSIGSVGHTAGSVGHANEDTHPGSPESPAGKAAYQVLADIISATPGGHFVHDEYHNGQDMGYAIDDSSDVAPVFDALGASAAAAFPTYASNYDKYLGLQAWMKTHPFIPKPTEGIVPEEKSLADKFGAASSGTITAKTIPIADVDGHGLGSVTIQPGEKYYAAKHPTNDYAGFVVDADGKNYHSIDGNGEQQSKFNMTTASQQALDETDQYTLHDSAASEASKHVFGGKSYPLKPGEQAWESPNGQYMHIYNPETQEMQKVEKDYPDEIQHSKYSPTQSGAFDGLYSTSGWEKKATGEDATLPAESKSIEVAGHTYEVKPGHSLWSSNSHVYDYNHGNKTYSAYDIHTGVNTAADTVDVNGSNLDSLENESLFTKHMDNTGNPQTPVLDTSVSQDGGPLFHMQPPVATKPEGVSDEDWTFVKSVEALQKEPELLKDFSSVYGGMTEDEADKAIEQSSAIKYTANGLQGMLKSAPLAIKQLALFAANSDGDYNGVLNAIAAKAQAGEYWDHSVGQANFVFPNTQNFTLLKPGEKMFQHDKHGFVLRHADGTTSVFDAKGTKLTSHGKANDDELLKPEYKYVANGGKAPTKLTINDAIADGLGPMDYDWDTVEGYEKASPDTVHFAGIPTTDTALYNYLNDGDNWYNHNVYGAYNPDQPHKPALTNEEIQTLPIQIKACLAYNIENDPQVSNIIIYKAKKGYYGATKPNSIPPTASYAQHISYGHTSSYDIGSYWSVSQKNDYVKDFGLTTGSLNSSNTAKLISDHLAGLQPAEETAPDTSNTQLLLTKNKYAAPLDGMHSKEQWTDQAGRPWMSKAFGNDPNGSARIEAEHYSNLIGKMYGFTQPETRAMQLEGKYAYVQHLMPAKSNLQSLSPKDLDDSLLTQAMQQHVLDWLISNHDSHGGNLLLSEDGKKIIGIDKGQAFKFFPSDKLAPDYLPPGNGANVWYDQFYHGIQNGSIPKERADAITTKVLLKAHQIQERSDAKFKTMLEEALKSRTNWPPEFPTREKFVEGLMERKHALFNDFEKMYKGVYVDSPYAYDVDITPLLNAKVGEAHTSLTPDYMDEVNKSKVHGKALMFDSMDLEDGHILTYTEKAANGSTTLKGEAKLLGEGDKKLEAWLKAQIVKTETGSDATVGGGNYDAYGNNSGYGGHYPDPADTLPMSDQWFNSLVPALKTVNVHWSGANEDNGPGKYNAESIQHMMNTKKAIQDALIYVTDKQETGSYPLSVPGVGTLVDGDHLAAFKDMANNYLGIIKEAEEAKAAGTKTPAASKPYKAYQYTPKPKVDVKTEYTSATAPYKLNELEDGTWQQVVNSTGEKYTIEPDKAQGMIKADGLAESTTATTNLGSQALTVIKRKSTSTNGTFNHDTGELEHSGSDLSEGNHGYEYDIEFPGVKIEYRLHGTAPADSTDETYSGDGVPRSQQGLLRFSVANHTGDTADLEQILDTLRTIGVNLDPASEQSLELQYWRMLSAQVAGRPDATQKYATITKEWQKIQAERVPGNPVEDEQDRLQKAWASVIGQDRVDNAKWEPNFSHYDLKNPDLTTGRPTWQRPDVTLKELHDFYGQGSHLTGMSVTSGYASPSKFVSSGGMYSTEERLRVLGQFVSGMSSSSDQPTGGANYIFTRQNGATGGYDNRVFLMPHAVLRHNTFSFNGDHYGNLGYRKIEASWEPNKAYTMKGGSNETCIKSAVSFLDDIGVVQFGDSDERDAAIKTMADAGVTEIYGIPISQLYVLSSSQAQEAQSKLWKAVLARESEGLAE